VDPDAQFKVSGACRCRLRCLEIYDILIVQVSDMLIERLHAVLVPARCNIVPDRRGLVRILDAVTYGKRIAHHLDNSGAAGIVLSPHKPLETTAVTLRRVVCGWSAARSAQRR